MPQALTPPQRPSRRPHSRTVRAKLLSYPAGSGTGGFGNLILGQDLLRLNTCARRRKEAIDNQMREPMHEAPRRHRRRIVVERPRVDLGDATQEQSLDARARRVKRRILRPLGENGPKHEAKEATVLVGEFNISETRPGKGGRAAGRALHGRGELTESLGCDGSEEIFLVGEMTVSRRRRHADAAGCLAQSNRMQPVLIQNLASRGQKRGRKVSVTIGPEWNPLNSWLSKFTL